MNNYVIAFKYTPFPDSEPVTEYFLPYSRNALLEIIDDKFLRHRLEASKDQNNAFKIFLEKYHLLDSPYIEQINTSPDAESQTWINDTEDISAPVLWDFLADAISVSAAEIGKNQGKMESLVKTVMENIFEIRNISDIRSDAYPYQWCYLHDKLAVRRYTEILDSHKEDVSTYIKHYMTYDTDIVSQPHFTLSNIGFTYGCCERKILAFSGYDAPIEIFSRWAPCWRCRPAIIDAQPCTYYAFAVSEDYAKNPSCDMSLKKYTVTRVFDLKVQ